MEYDDGHQDGDSCMSMVHEECGNCDDVYDGYCWEMHCKLEEDEDAYWMKIIDEEKTKGIKTINHEEFWRRVDELGDV